MNKRSIILFCCLAALVLTSCSQKKTETPKLSKESIKLFPIVLNDKWGYIDKTGKIVIEPQFDYAYKFFEGLARVRIGNEKTGKYGYIDTIGRFVVNPQFDNAGEFSEGLSWVRIGNIGTGKYGFINNNGKFIISPQYDNVDDFSEGFAAVKINGKYYYINKTGKIVFPQRKDTHIRIGSEIITNIIERGFHDARFFSDGLAAVQTEEKWGYIDKKGRFVINPQFDDAYDFSDGVAQVIISSKCGYINKSGKFVINPQFDSPLLFLRSPSDIRMSPLSNFFKEKCFSEGLTVVKANNEKGTKYGYIDKEGKFAINPQFDYARNFSEGLAVAKVNGKWGYIDKTGKFVIYPKYDWADDFSGGLAHVSVDELSTINQMIKPFKKPYIIWDNVINKRYGYIDKTGKYIWEPTK